MSEPMVSIIIVNWNERELLRNCLRSIFADTWAVDFEVIVVDNGSNDGSPEMVRKEFPTAKLIRNSKNEGFVRGLNKGIAAASSEFVVELNNDTEVGSDWLRALVFTISRDERIAAVGSKTLYPSGEVENTGAYFSPFAVNAIGKRNMAADQPREIDYPNTGYILRRSAVEEAGGFDEGFSPGYGEEADLCFRLKHAGYKVLYEPSAAITHHCSRSFAKLGGVRSQLAYQHGRLRFMLKNFPVHWLVLRIPLELSNFAASIVRGRAAGLLLAYLRIVTSFCDIISARLVRKRMSARK